MARAKDQSQRSGSVYFSYDVKKKRYLSLRLGSHCHVERLTARVRCVPIHRFRSDVRTPVQFALQQPQSCVNQLH